MDWRKWTENQNTIGKWKKRAKKNLQNKINVKRKLKENCIKLNRRKITLKRTCKQITHTASQWKRIQKYIEDRYLYYIHIFFFSIVFDAYVLSLILLLSVLCLSNVSCFTFCVQHNNNWTYNSHSHINTCTQNLCFRQRIEDTSNVHSII